MPEPAELIPFLRSLGAVRQYRPEQLPARVLDDIAQVVRWSGSASNRQQFQVLLTEDRRLLEALAGLDGFTGHLAGAAAGAVIVTFAERDELNAFDEGRLAERIMLAAAAHGVASSIGWLRGQGREEARQLVGLPDGATVRTTVAMGYPAERGRRGRRRKPMDELVRRV